MTTSNSLAPPRLTIALLSALALAYEILLIRLFSIIQWHHFAYMIISLALLGYGISGTVLAVFAAQIRRHFAGLFISNAVLFSVFMPVSFLLAQHLPFNAEEILWDPWQFFSLLGIYLLLALPFVFVANCIGMTFMLFKQQIGRIYAVDLLGAGMGSLLIIGLLFVVFPQRALLLLAATGLLATALAMREVRLTHRKFTFGLVVAAMLLAVIPDNALNLKMSPYKSLSQQQRIAGTQVVRQLSSPLGYLSVVANRQVPLRHVPGLSLHATTEPPAQLGIFTDGEGMTVITRHTGKVNEHAYLDQTTSALPYYLFKPERVLILGAGGGSEVLQAQHHQTRQIDAVELNPQLVRLVQQEFADFAGHLYAAPNVQVHVAEARGFVAEQTRHYDLIQLALLDSFGAASAGLYALSENYLYTSEAIHTYLDHLAPQGMLAITRWISLPPRDTLKLFATAIAALQQQGVTDPGQSLVLIRSWQTGTLLVKNGPFTASELARLQQFCTERGFDVAYYPGMPVTEANRRNILREAYFYNGATALLGSQPETFIANYKFNIRPASDDQPYFFQFFKWSSLPEILQLSRKGGMALLEAGYLVLVATLLQAVLASLVLILVPLWFVKKQARQSAAPPGVLPVFGYFAALGLAFLFIEIAFIQKFILYLHHPLYAVAVMLAAFLVFAGLGSQYVAYVIRQGMHRRAMLLAAGGIVGLSLSYMVVLPELFDATLAWPVLIKILLSVILVAPLAFCMGMPFPLGLARLAEQATRLIPWVWGVNGCASVISAVLATLLAVHFGFTLVIVVAALLYMASAALFMHAFAGDRA